MAKLTPAQIDALEDYSNSQMAKLCRNALAQLLSDPDQIHRASVEGDSALQRPQAGVGQADAGARSELRRRRASGG